MKTTEVESYADVGGIAHPDLNLRVVLRRCVIPKFYELVGPTAWRREVASVALVAGDQAKDIADDFGSMMEVVLADPTVSPTATQGLTYIGDAPLKVVEAEVNTTQGTPTGYYLVRRTTSALFKKIKFDCPADHSYTVYYVYYSHIQFSDDTTEVELDKYIPSQFQWALVEGLKSFVYTVRSGLGDRRKAEAEAEETMRIFISSQDREMGRGATPRYID